MLKRNPSQDTC